MSPGMKVAVREGSGPPPGYQHNIMVLNVAHREAEKLLTPDQYDYAADIVRQLARHDDPTHSNTLSIRKVEEFYEIREKGCLLGNLALRVYFWFDKENNTIVVLGVRKKQAEGQMPLGDKIAIRYRLRSYREGIYGNPATVLNRKAGDLALHSKDAGGGKATDKEQ